MWKTQKRWPVLLALLVAVVALAVGLLFLPSGRVTRENFQPIKVGMNEAEVRAILGKPWDDSLLDPDANEVGPILYLRLLLNSAFESERISPKFSHSLP
jgi:hypothetical protein